jgi:cellulose synthase operon protein C
MPMRRYVFALALLATVALHSVQSHAQDWDVGPARPSRPSRPSRPGISRPAIQRPTAPTTPASPVTDTDRNQRTIQHLLSVLLGATDDNAVALPSLLRLVRERDGSLDVLIADLERRASSSGSDAPGASLLLGHIQRQNGHVEDALAHYQRAALHTSSPAPFLALAECFRQLNRNTEAVAAYERALEFRSDHRESTLRALIDLSIASNDVNHARSWHQRLVAISPQSASVRRELADALMTRRMFAEAVTEYHTLSRSLAGDNRVLAPVLRDLGRAQLQGGQLDEAVVTFRRALTIAGADAGVRRELLDDMTELRTRRNELADWIHELEQSTPSWERAMLLGRLHAEQGRMDQAIASYRRASALRPADVDALVHLAQLLAQGAQLDALLAVRRRLAQVAPRNPTYVIELADGLIRNGRRAEALQTLARHSVLAGDDADMHERLAQVYARLGEQRLALRETELVARYDPSDPDALEALGERQLEQGDRVRALATWQRIRESARDRARGAAALAEVYARHDMAQQAIELYQEAIGLRPDELDFHKGLAVVEESLHQIDAAIASWRRVIELSRDHRELRREARTRIINLWNLQGRLEQRITALETAWGHTPPDLEAGRDLAEVYARLQRPEDSDRVLSRLVEADPNDIATLAALERTRTQRGDLAGAMDVLHRLVTVDTHHARDWYQRLAEHALALHRDAEAIENAARAVELNPDDASGHMRLGELYRASNDHAQAIVSFRRAIQLNDRLFSTYFQLADLYLAHNEAREALVLYRRVIRLAPDDDLVARAGRVAIQVAPATDTVEDLERDLASAAASAPTRQVFRKLMVDLYNVTCRPLIHTVRHGNPDAVVRARAQLVRLGVRALKPLLDTLSDDDPVRQRVALEVLGYLGNSNATTALLAVAEGQASREVRVGALRAAASLGDVRALPRLLTLARDADVTLATLATWGVARIHSPTATVALLRLLGQVSRSEIAAMAALGLSRREGAGIRAALLRALESDDHTLAAAAALSLGPMADAAITARLRVALLGSEWPRAIAFASLGAVSPTEGVIHDLAAGLFSPMILRVTGAEVGIRHVAARAMIRSTTHDEIPWQRVWDDAEYAASTSVMIARLLDPPDFVWQMSEEVLVRHRDAIVGAAIEAMTTPQGTERVLEALAVQGRFEPLNGDSPTVSAQSMAAVGALVDALVPSLMVAVEHPDKAVRKRALRILARSELPVVSSVLVRAVDDTDVTVSECALQLLAERTNTNTPLESLVNRLDVSTPWRLRLATVEALQSPTNPVVLEALVRTLSHDPLSIVRLAALRVLAPRQDIAFVRTAIEHAMNDDDEGVRTSAREANVSNPEIQRDGSPRE